MQQLKKELSQKIPVALANFDTMPNLAYVRLPVMTALYACSAATIWRGVKSGNIPQPTKLSERCTAWNVGLVRADLSNKGL